MTVPKLGWLLLATLTSTGAIAACSDSTDPDENESYSASLTSAAEVHDPTGNPTATGTASIQLENGGTRLRVTLNITGNLTSAVTMAHIHGRADEDETANVVFDFVPAMLQAIAEGRRTGLILNTTYELESPTLISTGVLKVSKDELIDMMNDGDAYVNVHTTTNPNGELRGQISR